MVSDSDGVVRLRLAVRTDPETDPERGARLIAGLHRELADLDVESVEPETAGPAPAGAKGTDPVTLGALVVAFSASGGVFTTVLGTVRDWLERQSGRHLPEHRHGRPGGPEPRRKVRRPRPRRRHHRPMENSLTFGRCQVGTAVTLRH